jgi:hypothetical protein
LTKTKKNLFFSLFLFSLFSSPFLSHKLLLDALNLLRGRIDFALQLQLLLAERLLLALSSATLLSLLSLSSSSTLLSLLLLLALFALPRCAIRRSRLVARRRRRVVLLLLLRRLLCGHGDGVGLLGGGGGHALCAGGWRRVHVRDG